MDPTNTNNLEAYVFGGTFDSPEQDVTLPFHRFNVNGLSDCSNDDE